VSLLTWGGVPLTWGDSLLTWGPYTPPTPALEATGEPVVDWLWSVGPGASSASPGPVIDIDAYGRTITVRNSGHGWAQFTIDGRSDAAAFIVPKVSDLWCYRDSELVFRGRIVHATPALDNRANRWEVLAIDYRGMLTSAAAVEPPIPVYSGVDQGAIVWDLIDRWQTLPGGNWGITNGDGATSGTPRDETDITPGAPTGEVIDRLGDRDGGFEWEITPELVLNRYYPRRVRILDTVLDWGGEVIAAQAVTAPFANTVVVVGDEDTTPVTATSDLTGDERGRWTRSESFPSVTRQETLVDKAAFIRDQLARTIGEWTATLAPNRWEGPQRLWLGDVVRFEANDGGVAVSGAHRVTEIQITCGDAGTETVNVALEQYP
jgi:hypothetical protein